jgi:hypothetical protein
MDFQTPDRHLILLSSNHFGLLNDLPDWILPSPPSPLPTKGPPLFGFADE